MCKPNSPAPLGTLWLAQKAVVGNPAPVYQRGEDGYADWVIVALHGLREYLDQPCRRLLDILHELPRIVEILGLELDTLPNFSTICARKQELKMPHWRNLLRLSADLHDLGEIQAIDATGFDRIAASQHFVNRTNYTFKAVKTTAPIDCKTGSILDIQCSMKQPADSQIGWQVLQRNLDKVTKNTANKAYDWWIPRQKLQTEGVEPVIKHREFGWHGVANNVLLDDTTYHQRSDIESTFFALPQRFCDTLRART